MKIEVAIENKVVELAAEKAIVKYLSTGKGAALIERKVNKKVDELVNERRIRSAINERLSRLITEENMKDVIEAFSDADYEARVGEIFMKILGNTSDFRKTIKEEIRKSVRVG
jgi:hypothetical protein